MLNPHGEDKGKDAAIKEEAHQLQSLMALNYSDYGSYCQLQYGWISNTGMCAGAFNGTYATNAQSICVNIINNQGTIGIYSNIGLATCDTAYSFMIYLNDGKVFCTGSSGMSAEYAMWGSPGDGTTPGCYNNP